MVVKLFEKYLQDHGYVLHRTKYPEITEYYKEESSSINVLQVMDVKADTSLDNQTFLDQKGHISGAMSRKDVHIMTLVFFEDYAKALEVAWDEYMCWFIDKKNLVIAPAEERVEDFYGLKHELTGWLDEIRALYLSGDVNAISQRLMNQQEKDNYEKRKKKKPAPVSVTLVVITSIIFMTSYVIGNEFIRSGQLDKNLITQGQYYRLITAMFLHAGIEHLVGNMLLLYLLGEVVENKTGSVKYAFIYILSGLIGNVVSYVYRLNLPGEYASIGASGAVYGIIGAMLYLVVRKTKGMNIQIQRLLIMIAYCVYSSFATAHVDYAAHIGGLIGGFVITALLCPKGGKAEGES